jgi:hypothetical protein
MNQNKISAKLIPDLRFTMNYNFKISCHFTVRLPAGDSTHTAIICVNGIIRSMREVRKQS